MFTEFNDGRVRLTLTHIRRLSRPLAWALASLLVVLPLGSHAADAVLCIKGEGEMTVRGAHASGGETIVQAHAESHHAFPTIEKAGHGSSHPTGCLDVLLPPGADGDCASVKPDLQPDVKPVAAVVATLEADESPFVRATASNTVADEHFQFLSLAPVRSTQFLI